MQLDTEQQVNMSAIAGNRVLHVLERLPASVALVGLMVAASIIIRKSKPKAEWHQMAVAAFGTLDQMLKK